MKRLICTIILLAGLALAQNPPVREVVCTDAGDSDTYACTPTPAVGSYTTGLRVRLYPNTANTGAATVNISSLGDIAIKKVAGGITTDLATSDIRSGQFVLLIYDGTNFQMLSQLGNAGSSGTDIGTVWIGNLLADTIAVGTTYISPLASSDSSTINYRTWITPVSGTLKDFYIRSFSTQNGNCKLVLTVQTGAYGSLADTDITTTIAKDVVAGTFSDTTHTASVSAGDLITIKAVQGDDGATCASASPQLLWLALRIY